MAKANLSLPDGTQIVIEGSPEEITKLLRMYAGSPQAPSAKTVVRSSHRPSQQSKSVSGKKGPQAYIAALADSGFFKQKRNIAEVQKKLEEGGHIYAQTSLSAPLIRLVRGHQLRRLKEKGGWVYVNS